MRHLRLPAALRRRYRAMKTKAKRGTPEPLIEVPWYQGDEPVPAYRRRKGLVRTSYPSARFAFALERVGLSGLAQEHRALRSLIHECLGAPPPDHCSTNALAEKVLELIRAGALHVLRPA